MIRIAFIAGQLGLGGSEQQLYYLLTGLDRQCYQPLVLTLNPGQGDYWETPITTLGVPVLPVPRFRLRLLRALHIARLVWDRKPQILHSWGLHTNPYAALSGALAQVPVRLGSIRESFEGPVASPWLRWIGLVGLDGIVVNSMAAAHEIAARRFSRPPLHVVQNAVSCVGACDRVGLRRELASLWQLPLSGLWLVTVGRLDENKNIALLVEAVATLRAEFPELRLVVIGDGPQRSALEAISRASGVDDIVTFASSIPGVISKLPAFDLFCLTSRSEGMPNVVMEASAAGLPVICTAVGGTRELIVDGLTGFLVPVDDITVLVQRLAQLLSDPGLRQRMGSSGCHRMAEQFSVERMVAEMTRVYEQALVAKGVV